MLRTDGLSDHDTLSDRVHKVPSLVCPVLPKKPGRNQKTEPLGVMFCGGNRSQMLHLSFLCSVLYKSRK